MRTFSFMFFLILATSLSVYGQKDQKAPPAKKGDMVTIVTVTVKNESKSEFEGWIKDVMYAALYKSQTQVNKDQLKATRWLEAAQQNEDKTWTYAWIMDPVIPNADYDITQLLIQQYGEEAGKKHMDKYMSFLSKEPQVISLIQTDY